MKSPFPYRRLVSIFKMIRFRHRRILAVCILGFCFTIFHYCLYQHQPSIEDRMQGSTLKILNAIDKNTSSLVLPDESTNILQPTSSSSCKGTGQDHFLLFMFITSPENEERRGIIRKLFADGQAEWESSIFDHDQGYPVGESIKFLFLIGLPKDEKVKERLKEEWQSYGDMVVDDFKESYLNLTLKTLRMLKWVNSNCPDVRYLAKIDDDVHLNKPNLLNFLYQYNETAGRNLIAGRRYPRMPIDGDPTSKWFTPKFLWPGLFPEFVAGFFYVLGSQSRKDLYAHALETPLFHLEDVFLTGIVRSKHTNVSVINVPGIYEFWPSTYNVYSPCSMKDAVAVHPLSGAKMSCWSQFAGNKLECGHWPIFMYC